MNHDIDYAYTSQITPTATPAFTNVFHPIEPFQVRLALGRSSERERASVRQGMMLDRVAGVGIAAHEGLLFGRTNQLIGLLTAMGLVLLKES